MLEGISPLKLLLFKTLPRKKLDVVRCQIFLHVLCFQFMQKAVHFLWIPALWETKKLSVLGHELLNINYTDKPDA